MRDHQDIQSACLTVLETAGPLEKAERARDVAFAWRNGQLDFPHKWRCIPASHRPSRPPRPELVPPGQVPRRRLNSPAGRIALLHAIAHIEFNAIDLAFDLVARFGAADGLNEDQRRRFVDDWINVGDDEARHFTMVQSRLAELDAEYGDHVAHNGLWDAAISTSHDLAARLAVAPLVLEARGLDVTPGMIDRLISAGDTASADVLRVIYDEEIAHVAAGARWFDAVSSIRQRDPLEYYQELVKQYFSGGLKMPFNIKARKIAGFPEEYYLPLAQ